jgi:hypothetical protein
MNGHLPVIAIHLLRLWIVTPLFFYLEVNGGARRVGGALGLLREPQHVCELLCETREEKYEIGKMRDEVDDW